MVNKSDLSLYKPEVSISRTFAIDATLPDNELCFDLFKKLILARKTEDFLYLSTGQLLKVFRDRQLYKQLDFDNFSEFLASEDISFSRERAYLLIRVYEYYSEYLNLDESVMRDFPIMRLSMMIPSLKKLGSKEQQVREIERVKSLRHNDFVREVKAATNSDGKPSFYWSEEASKWIINYYDNTTNLISLGDFHKEEDPPDE